MKSFEIERNRANTEALDTEIRASLGDVYTGLSARPGMVILYFTDDATGSQMQAARDLTLLHDPEILSSRQAQEVARRQSIADAREHFITELDVSEYDGEPRLIQALAERIAWLEQEIRDLRGL